MDKISYEHGSIDNYMVIESSENFNDYKLKMIENNEINCLLKVKTCIIDNVSIVRYVITSKQSLKTKFGNSKLNFQGLKSMFVSIKNLLEVVDEYLLSMDDLVLNSETIFFDSVSNEVQFCYNPAYKKDFKYQLDCLVNELIMITDHMDVRAIETIYGINNICNDNNFSLGELHKFVSENILGEKLQYEDKLNFNESYTSSNNDKISCSRINNIKGFSTEDLIDENVNENGVYAKNVYKKGINEKNIYKNNVYENDFEESNTGNKCFSDEKPTIGNTYISRIMNKLKRKFDSNVQKNNIYSEEKEELLYLKEDSDYDVHSSKKEDECEYENDRTMLVSEINNNVLRMLVGFRNEANIELVKYPFIIGKNSRESDAVIDNKSISKMHCKFSKEDGKYFLEDMNSRNGTFVNDIRVEPYEIVEVKIGDLIRISDNEYVFR